jgi:hypothetical protein
MTVFEWHDNLPVKASQQVEIEIGLVTDKSGCPFEMPAKTLSHRIHVVLAHCGTKLRDSCGE